MPIAKVQDTLLRGHDGVREQRRDGPPDAVIARSVLVRARRPAPRRRGAGWASDVAESRWVWRGALAGLMSSVVTPISAADEVRFADAAASPANRRLASKCGAAIGHLRAAHRFDPATFWRRRRQSPAGERHMMVGPGTGKVDIRVALEQPSCLPQWAASCRLRAAITACRHHRHRPSLRARHDKGFRSRGVLLEHLRNPAIDALLTFEDLEVGWTLTLVLGHTSRSLAAIRRSFVRTRRGKKSAGRRQQTLRL